jgi:adenylate cyclase
MRRKTALRLGVYSVVVALATTLGIAIGVSRLGDSAELRAYDIRFALRGALPASSPITILAVDDRSLAAIPRPVMLWHGEFARVFEAMVPANPAAVGVDFIFSDIALFDPDGQRALSGALIGAGDAGIPMVFAYQVRAHGADPIPAAIQYAVLGVGHALGFANLTTDPDDFVRRQQLTGAGTANVSQPSFALALATAYARRARLPPPQPPEDAPLLINFRGPGAFAHVSFADAVEAARRGDAAFFRDHFRDRIVLVGHVGDEDLHSTPQYYWRREPARSSLRTAGIEIHAHTIATLLEGLRIRRLSPAADAALAASISLLVAAACFGLAPAWALSAAALVLAAYAGIAVLGAFARGWWLLVVPPVAAGALTAGLAQAVNFQLEGRERRRLRDLFKRYVDDAVIERIVDAPERVPLGGERRHVAVLFADIRNFTTRSEKTPPEILVRDLNQYFAAVVPAIRGRSGMVDKFIGDGIMAIFGAPMADGEAALHAVEAGQAMLAALDGLNARLEAVGSEPIAIGIGIHAGEAVIGNVGTPDRMEYTAIGDVVNVASRIEGLNRALGTELLISAAVFERIDGKVEAERVGEQPVKGRGESVAVYKVGRVIRGQTPQSPNSA